MNLFSDPSTPPRFIALYEALEAQKPEETGLGRWFQNKRRTRLGQAFAAALLMPAEGEANPLAAAALAARDALDAKTLFGRSPAHWATGAALAAHGRQASVYEALRRPPTGEASQRYQPDAALLMTLLQTPDIQTRRRYVRILDAFTPGAWKRGVRLMKALEFYGVFHAIRGSTAEEIAAKREAAEAVFSEDRKARKHALEAGWLASVLEADPAEMLAAFTALESARREQRKIRGATGPDTSLLWAGLGLTPEDLPDLTAIFLALPKQIGEHKSQRVSLAECLWIRTRQERLGVDTTTQILLTAHLHRRADNSLRPAADGGGGGDAGGDGGGGG